MGPPAWRFENKVRERRLSEESSQVSSLLFISTEQGERSAARSEKDRFQMMMQGLPTRVLLIDDNEDHYIQLRDALLEKSTLKIELRWASGYKAGLDAIATGSFDVCLLDCRLGDRHGLELLQEAGSRSAKTPIIFLTGRENHEMGLEAIQTGAVDYLTKGDITVPLLDRSIRHALGRRQEAELIKANRMVRALSECNNALIHAEDELELLHEICRICVEVGGYRMAWVGYAEHGPDSRVTPVAKYGYEEGYLEAIHVTWDDTDHGRGPVGASIRKGTPIVIRFAATHSDFAPWRLEAARREYAAVVGMPLLVEGKAIGSLAIYARDPDAFDDEEVKLLCRLSRNLSYGIGALRAAKARLLAEEALKKARDELERRTEQALAEEAVWRRLLIEQSRDGIVILDQGGKVWEANRHFAEMLGYSSEEVSRLHVWDWDAQWPREHLLEMIRRVDAQGDHFETRHRRRDGTVYDVEISTNGAVLGEQKLVLCVCRDITERKRAEEILKRSEKELRYLSSRLLAAQEEERKRIAGELHDSIGQTLAAMKFSIENALQTADRNNPKEVFKLLEFLISIVRNAIEETRSIYMGLRPSILDDFGIAATIHWFCRDFQRIYPAHYLEVEVGVQEAEIPKDIKITIFRVIQEALNNMAKHSRAELVELKLMKTDHHITLTIEDNGTGFDPDAILSRDDCTKGLGLTSMHERVELSGGIFSIESVPGEGTIVRASWPCAC